jgi:hypothetical protein
MQATATAHVVSFPWRRAPRAFREVAATRRVLRSAEGVCFAVAGRTSGGDGSRNVSRSISPRRIVVLVQWADARATVEGRALLEARWGKRGAQVWSGGLAPIRASGTWRGSAAFAPDAVSGDADGDTGEMIASLTYARIRPSRMAHFYMLGFPRVARRMTGNDSPMLAGIGFGDIPVRHACTFSVWPSTAALIRVVQGRAEPHGAIARRSNDEGWLTESLFARFVVVDHAGIWAGADPLA